MSANEEFQSTNEELETAKEELQSTNEELTTTVEELRSKNEDLSRLNMELDAAHRTSETGVFRGGGPGATFARLSRDIGTIVLE